jgi:hypothetical protein
MANHFLVLLERGSAAESKFTTFESSPLPLSLGKTLGACRRCLMALEWPLLASKTTLTLGLNGLQINQFPPD